MITKTFLLIWSRLTRHNTLFIAPFISTQFITELNSLIKLPSQICHENRSPILAQITKPDETMKMTELALHAIGMHAAEHILATLRELHHVPRLTSEG